MSWATFAKYGAIVALVAAFYMWADHNGWERRDKKVPNEIKNAVDDAVKNRDEACAKSQKLIGGINEKLTDDLKNTNALYANALGSLYDATHDRGKAAGTPVATGGDDGATSRGRLYYADPAGAVPTIERSRIATDQASQLIVCQAYVCGITKGKAAHCEPR